MFHLLAVIDPAIPSGAGVVLGAFIAWLVTIRRFSGKIDSSDAAELWEDSRSIRDWSQRQIARLEQRVRDLEEENAGLRLTIKQRVLELEEENTGLRLQIKELLEAK